jgi:lipopolysaccharide transport system permease protein
MSELVLRTARPVPLPTLLNPLGMVMNLWARRDLTRQFAMRFFHARYRGTYLGMAWAILLPLLMLAVFTFIFNFVFTARGADPTETRSQYAVWLFCGMVIYAIFSETVVRSCSLVLENPNYVTKVVFPLEILPAASLGSSLLFASFGMGLVLIGTAVFFGSVHWTLVLLPLVLLPLISLTLGVSWFLASLGVFIRDIGNVTSIIVGNLLFFLTPIFYRVEHLPEHLQGAAMLNPLAIIVAASRDVVVYGRVPNMTHLGLTTVISLATMQLGYAWFMKSKRGFADVL